MHGLFSKKKNKSQGVVYLHSRQITFESSTSRAGCLVPNIPSVDLKADIVQANEFDSAERGRSSLSPLSSIAEDTDDSESPPLFPRPYKGPPAPYQRDEDFFGPHGFARCINKVQSLVRSSRSLLDLLVQNHINGG